MTEEQLKEQIELQKCLSAGFEKLTSFVKSDEFKNLDGLNKDLVITQLSGMQSLLGIISIRVGLNIATIQKARKEKAAESEKESTDEKENTADETGDTTSEVPGQ